MKGIREQCREKDNSAKAENSSYPFLLFSTAFGLGFKNLSCVKEITNMRYDSNSRLLCLIPRSSHRIGRCWLCLAVHGIKVESGHWRQAWIWTVKSLLVCQAAGLKDVDSGRQFVEDAAWKHVVGEAKERITQHSATREQEKPALSLLEY